MPWTYSKDCLPPKGIELQLFSKGKRWKAKLDTFDIVNGMGGLNPDLPEFWAYPEQDIPDPEPHKLKGLDHVKAGADALDAKVDPKLNPDGKPPEVGAGIFGHDGFVNR
jgi:hypothetical protein